MSNTVYSISSTDTSSEIIRPNNITVALALNGKKLTKTITPGGEIAYDQAYHFKFFNRDIVDLAELFQATLLLLDKYNCCYIRGISKSDDETLRQRRLFHGSDATIIEQDCNWFALDIDGYGNSSGNLRQDTEQVLLALGLCGVQAFAIPSAGYLRKPGIRIRLFMWNSVKISCLALKKYFERYKHVVDLALFHPIQPIYIARPIFNGLSDPCKVTSCWIPGQQMYTEIPKYIERSGQKVNPKYTRKQARTMIDAKFRGMADIGEGDRHVYLRDQVSYLAAKQCARGLFDEDEMKDEIAEMAMMYWKGNAKNDRAVIEYAFKRAIEEIDGEDDAF